tara:strand:- start:2670 stop:3329 length:660 start_codon:yes stop_codon:yes gene_type:complete
MQHCQPNQFGGAAGQIPLHTSDTAHTARHSALLLIGPRGTGRLTPRVVRRVLDRLIAPRAQVEGVDFHLSDPALPDIACTAAGFALVLPPLGNLSNPYYAVHPRRNDRFLRALPALKALYPDVDFAPLTFTGHALGVLAHTCPERYALVRQALMQEWHARMHVLLGRLPVNGVLIDLPSAPWLLRPQISGLGTRQVFIDPDDRAAAATCLLDALTRRIA